MPSLQVIFYSKIRPTVPLVFKRGGGAEEMGSLTERPMSTFRDLRGSCIRGVSGGSAVFLLSLTAGSPSTSARRILDVDVTLLMPSIRPPTLTCRRIRGTGAPALRPERLSISRSSAASVANRSPRNPMIAVTRRGIVGNNSIRSDRDKHRTVQERLLDLFAAVVR